MLNFCYQQREWLWQGNWEKDFSQPRRIQGECRIAHNKLFGSVTWEEGIFLRYLHRITNAVDPLQVYIRVNDLTFVPHSVFCGNDGKLWMSNWSDPVLHPDSTWANSSLCVNQNSLKAALIYNNMSRSWKDEKRNPQKVLVVIPVTEGFGT